MNMKNAVLANIEDTEVQIKQDITVNSLITTVNRLKSPRAYPYKCKSVTSYLLLILLANANDHVTWDNRAIRCDTCDQWFHINCQDIHSKTFSYFVDHKNISVRWDGIICDNPNYNSLCYGSTAISTNNSFNLLLDGTLDMSTASKQECVRPKYTSTPKREKQETRNKPFIPLRILNVNCQSIRNK
ncbi:unnamed protein product [Mytilus coruscus]|uniref:Uncharacterized protein n=1 Tax=Mytilus coruscus TaxID=42192 RepID=A0A6J7ZWK9_MYTCO|nr:unnamed protein product [Mytilus coruscus]